MATMMNLARRDKAKKTAIEDGAARVRVSLMTSSSASAEGNSGSSSRE